MTAYVRTVSILTIAALLGGCAMFGGGPSKEDLIMKTVQDWKTALEAENLEGMMACVSEDFVSSEGGDRSQLQAFLKNVIDEGTLSGATMDMEDAEISFGDDGKAGVDGLWIYADAGSAGMELTLAEDADGVWRIVGMYVNA